jgi:hypothetical protein
VSEASRGGGPAITPSATKTNHRSVACERRKM